MSIKSRILVSNLLHAANYPSPLLSSQPKVNPQLSLLYLHLHQICPGRHSRYEYHVPSTRRLLQRPQQQQQQDLLQRVRRDRMVIQDQFGDVFPLFQTRAFRPLRLLLESLEPGKEEHPSLTELGHRGLRGGLSRLVPFGKVIPRDLQPGGNGGRR